MQLKTGMYQESINTEVKSILVLTYSNRINSLSLLIAGAFLPTHLERPKLQGRGRKTHGFSFKGYVPKTYKRKNG